MKSIKLVLILCNLAFLLNACAGIGTLSQVDLEGRTWFLTNLNGDEPVEGHQPTLEFESGQVSGTTGCNHYEGIYQIEADTILIENLYSTERACLNLEGVMEQEKTYMGLLRTADRFDLINDSLDIMTATGQTLIFTSQPATIHSVPLTGESITSTYMPETMEPTSITSFEPPTGSKEYRDPVAGVTLFIPEDWAVTGVIEGKSAIFQSYPEDKYVGGEGIESGDTKCDLNIQPVGTSANDLVQQWQSDTLTIVVSKEAFTLQTGLIGQRFVIDSMGRVTVYLVEFDHRVVVLTCFGDFTQVDAIAVTLRGLE